MPARKKFGDEMLGILTGLVKDLDQVALGWTLDRKADNTLLDVSVTARSGTPLASQMAIEQIASGFAGSGCPGPRWPAIGPPRSPP